MPWDNNDYAAALLIGLIFLIGFIVAYLIITRNMGGIWNFPGASVILAQWYCHRHQSES